LFQPTRRPPLNIGPILPTADRKSSGSGTYRVLTSSSKNAAAIEYRILIIWAGYLRLSIYADTSFFVSLYLPDRHSAEAERRMIAKPRIWFSPLHRADWVHAISQHVFRKEISALEARRVRADLDRDLRNGLWLMAALPESVWHVCAELARMHGPRLGIRTLDSLHVAAALEFEATAFWTFDERQVKLAHAAGLRTS
jgi:predicted nucleic acid-binding protein